jgi:hypothetical protein
MGHRRDRRVSGRRLTVVAIIGSMDREYPEFGLEPDLRARGRALDERLARPTDLRSQWSVPRIPVWCGAAGPPARSTPAHRWTTATIRSGTAT